jgi:hypothetical protein
VSRSADRSEHWIDRVWTSGPLRWAWVLVFTLALAGHLAVTVSAHRAAVRFGFIAPQPAPRLELTLDPALGGSPAFDEAR